MKIAIASDHKGYHLKVMLISYLKKKKFEVLDLGTDSVLSVDYPKFAFLLGDTIKNGCADYGIAICGTGIGISIACNKVMGIRCAKVDNVQEAKFARLHNDANILALNGSIMGFKAKDIVDAFFKTNFSNEERHVKRLKMIKEYEEFENDEF